MGQVIAGRFELDEHIASGASGHIWTATDLKLGARCAAKVLRRQDSGELLRFVREQGVRLDHPHLATPYGWAADDHDVAIAMPLVSGGTLESALADHGPFSSALAAFLLLQLLDGLTHVHAKGWIHRDVKPANILMEPTGTGQPHLRLGDFGTAMRVGEPRLTNIGFIHGTTGYIAPEGLVGAAPSQSGDLYAAGVVALRMLRPHLTEPDELTAALSELSHGGDDALELLGDVILGLTSVDPATRTATAASARTTLSPLIQSSSFTTAAGEDFEVFDHLDEQREPTPVPVKHAESPRQHAGPLVLLFLGATLMMAAVVVALL